MKHIAIGFLFGLSFGAICVLWGSEAWLRELEETNIFLVKKLKEENDEKIYTHRD